MLFHPCMDSLMSQPIKTSQEAVKQELRRTKGDVAACRKMIEDWMHLKFVQNHVSFKKCADQVSFKNEKDSQDFPSHVPFEFQREFMHCPICITPRTSCSAKRF